MFKFFTTLELCIHICTMNGSPYKQFIVSHYKENIFYVHLAITNDIVVFTTL